MHRYRALLALPGARAPMLLSIAGVGGTILESASYDAAVLVAAATAACGAIIVADAASERRRDGRTRSAVVT
jgi:hypothetical protein